MKVRIKFYKHGSTKFIGHLDMMRFFQKAMRRAEIPIAFTEGYSPHMIMSFAQPLGIGLTSDAEYLDIELKEYIASDAAVYQLNKVMVEGIEILNFKEISADRRASGMAIVSAAAYRVTPSESMDVPMLWKGQAKDFLAQDEIIILKKTKRSEREVDIKPMIYKMIISTGHIEMTLAAGSEENLKPDLVMEAFLTYMQIHKDFAPFHYHRLEVYSKDSAGTLVPLDVLGSNIQ